MTRVFVTDGQVRSALAVVRSLGDDAEIVCGETTRVATAFASKYTDETVVYPDPAERPTAFVRFLAETLRDREIDVLLPVGHEASRQVNRHRDRLAETTHVPVAGGDRFATAVDKGRVLELAARHDVPHPETVRPETATEAVAAGDRLGYPVVVKPPTGSGSRGVSFPSSSAELRRAFRETSGDPLVQELVPREGRGVGAAFLYWHGEPKAAFAYERLREYPPGGGPSTLRRSIDDQAPIEHGQTLLSALDWHGVAMVEFKRDPTTGEVRLLEINPRFWGSLHLPLYAGIDFPKLLVACALGEDPDPVFDYETGVRCRYLLPGDVLSFLSRRSLSALPEYLPLRDEGLYYDVVDRDDPWPVVGRLAAMGRYSLDPEMWRRVVFRSSATPG